MSVKHDYFYGSIFAILAAVALLYATQGGWTLLMAWPSISFFILALAYFISDARWFGKRADGSRHWLATFLLLPYLLLVHVVWRLQICFSREPAFHALDDYVLLSRRLLSQELPPHIDRVCDLTCEFRDPRTIRSRHGYVCYPILDAGTCETEKLIRLARQFPPENQSPLVIHCANGHGRTGMFAAIWLLTHGLAPTAEAAMAMTQQSRPAITLRSRQRQVVVEAAALLQQQSVLY